MTYDEAIEKANKYRARAERYALGGPCSYRLYESNFQLSQTYLEFAEAIRRTDEARFLVWCDQEMMKVDVEDDFYDPTYCPEFTGYAI